MVHGIQNCQHVQSRSSIMDMDLFQIYIASNLTYAPSLLFRKAQTANQEDSVRLLDDLVSLASVCGPSFLFPVTWLDDEETAQAP